MPRKPTRKPQARRLENDPAQFGRFIEAARVAGASDDPKDLERALKKIAPEKGCALKGI
jgi:hypothetical protein